MSTIRIMQTRAPGLVPGLIREIGRAKRPVVLIPESFTLACETEIVRRSGDNGIFDLRIFSPSSLAREIRELTGYGNKKPVSAAGQNMIIARILHHDQEKLQYYRDAVSQPALAQKIANQLNDFTRARLTPAFLRGFQPAGRRARAKIADIALLWDDYEQALGGQYEDVAGQWLSALSHLGESGILRDAQLLIYGFDYITHDILNLIQTAVTGENAPAEVIIGLISDDVGPDREIFRAANDSVRGLVYYLQTHPFASFSVRREQNEPIADPGIAYVEKSIYASGAFASEKVYQRAKKTVVIRPDPVEARRQAMETLDRAPVPGDLSHVRAYYARNSYLECQHACQTLIDWHQSGVPWEDMAIAVCEQNTLPSLLPLTLSAAGIPFNAKQDQPILMSGYAQYVLSLLRVLRLGFCQNDVLRMMKTGYTALSATEVMDMENYARRHGIHRSRWLKPFHMPEQETEKEKAERMEELRRRVIEPITALRAGLSVRGRTGKQAATILFRYITDQGVYEKLLTQEEEYAEQGDDLGIDRNRQVWTAINELLDSVAVFIGDEPLPLHDLCAMLESSLSARSIKSLPQLSHAVMVAPPQMFFSSGVRCMIVMGLQENELSAAGGILSESERDQLERYIEEENRAYYRRQYEGSALPPDPGTPSGQENPVTPDLTEKNESPATLSDKGQSAQDAPRPFSKIGQSLLDLAARQKQDVYQAVSLAREQLMISCAGARPSGGVLTQSMAFKRIYSLIAERAPQNATGGLMNADIRPFAPAFALETLAVRLRETKDSADGFLRGEKAEDRLWRDALAALYASEQWQARTTGVLNGLHVSVKTAGLTPEQARALYQGRAMSISRVEAFSTCPWRHLLQYGLELFPDAAFRFEANEQGTFNHDVIRMFLDEAMKLPEWPRLTEEQENMILNRVLNQRVKKWEGGILRSDILHRYQGLGIIHGVRTAVASMMRAFRLQPHFLPMAAEVPFGMPDGRSRLLLPPVLIRTSDGETVAFSGKIDRIDRLTGPDGKEYFMIIDNKMSERTVQQNSLVSGLQLQLPLYIRAARNGLTGFTAAGGLYQPVQDILIDSEDRGRILEQIDFRLRPTGIILNDKGIQEAMRPVKISKENESKDTVSVVTEAEIDRLCDGAEAVIAGQIDRIRNGETSPDPVQDERRSPCETCDHPDACPFDLTLPGCRIRKLDHDRRMDLPVPNA